MRNDRQAATNAATCCYQIYKLGAPVEDLRLATTTDYLQQCYTTLEISLQPNQQPGQVHSPLPSSGVDLKNLSADCCESAKHLREELEALKKSPGGGRREAVAKLLQRKRKAKEIQMLKERLEKNQRTLDTIVLTDVRQTILALSSRQDNQYSNLPQRLSKLSDDLASCRVSAAGTFKTVIDDVKLHFDRTVQALMVSQAQQQKLKERQDRYFESLRFDDINVRRNEIFDHSHKTFDWIFEDKLSRSWDSLSDWLRRGHDVYWINGKAGSGKSTLMRFLVNDQRTSHALNIWADGSNYIVLTFYFWLSGSKLQRSMKGVLCSLLHQITSTNSKLLEELFQTNELISRKRTIGDWSLKELKDVLQSVVESENRTGHICIFLDGIDEFDQNDDVRHLLDLIEGLTKFENTKFCVSSRPEAYIEKRLSQYNKLRLQDLTADDMKSCISNTLDDVYKLCPSKSIETKDIKKFTRLMTEKADGVFLWVHFALRSLLKGLRNEDDFQVLLMRVEELPSEMEQLYEQMWRRLNGDEMRYQHEASKYFSYHEYFPMSLFEMMVVLQEDIQKAYMQDLRPQNATLLADKCDILRTRILTRCAGLLEVVTVIDDTESGYITSPPAKNFSAGDSEIKEAESTEAMFPNSGTQPTGDEDSRSVLSRLPISQSRASNNSVGERRVAYPDLQQYQSLKVNFLHRTARDFLLDTKAGRAIAGETPESRDERFANVMRARMSALLQRLKRFGNVSVEDIISSIGKYDSEYEIDLIRSLRQVCMALRNPGSRFRDITQGKFWRWDGTDFSGRAAYYGCIKYVQYFIEREFEYVSPYYRGFLFHSAVKNLVAIQHAHRKIQLASWLAQNGAEVRTKQWGFFVETPFERLLKEIMGLETSIPAMTTQALQLVEKLCPANLKSTDRYIVFEDVEAEKLEVQNNGARRGYLYTEMGANSLYRLATYKLARHPMFASKIRYVSPLPKSGPFLVLTQRGTSYFEYRRVEDYDVHPKLIVRTSTGRSRQL